MKHIYTFLCLFLLSGVCAGALSAAEKKLECRLKNITEVSIAFSRGVYQTAASFVYGAANDQIFEQLKNNESQFRKRIKTKLRSSIPFLTFNEIDESEWRADRWELEHQAKYATDSKIADLKDALERLKALYAKGILSTAQYNDKEKRMLALIKKTEEINRASLEPSHHGGIHCNVWSAEFSQGSTQKRLIVINTSCLLMGIDLDDETSLDTEVETILVTTEENVVRRVFESLEFLIDKFAIEFYKVRTGMFCKT